jgi:hypothetical protein
MSTTSGSQTDPTPTAGCGVLTTPSPPIATASYGTSATTGHDRHHTGQHPREPSSFRCYLFVLQRCPNRADGKARPSAAARVLEVPVEHARQREHHRHRTIAAPVHIDGSALLGSAPVNRRRGGEGRRPSRVHPPPNAPPRRSVGTGGGRGRPRRSHRAPRCRHDFRCWSSAERRIGAATEATSSTSL